MNERIKELAEQAGVFEGVFTKHGGVPCNLKGYGMLPDEMEKFVELIVKECAGIDFRRKVGLTDYLGYEIGKVIKSHFGVKE
jgi:hypothetical protein